MQHNKEHSLDVQSKQQSYGLSKFRVSLVVIFEAAKYHHLLQLSWRNNMYFQDHRL